MTGAFKLLVVVCLTTAHSLSLDVGEVVQVGEVVEVDLPQIRVRRIKRGESHV